MFIQYLMAPMSFKSLFNFLVHAGNYIVLKVYK